MEKKIILSAKEIDVILHRLSCQLIENHLDFNNTALIGIQPRGAFLAKRLVKILQEKHQISSLDFGVLDITFFRDDFRRSQKPLLANSTEINFIVENKRVVFIDDVLYTGRSIRAALTAIQSFGRPQSVELLTFIDRRFSRHLPIQPDYKGKQIDAIENEHIVVNWQEKDAEDCVYLIQKEN